MSCVPKILLKLSQVHFWLI